MMRRFVFFWLLAVLVPYGVHVVYRIPLFAAATVFSAGVLWSVAYDAVVWYAERRRAP